MTGAPEFNCRRNWGDFYFCYSVQTGPGGQSASYPRGVKQPGCESAHFNLVPKKNGSIHPKRCQSSQRSTFLVPVQCWKLSTKLATETYPESIRSSSHHHNHSTRINFNVIFPYSTELLYQNSERVSLSLHSREHIRNINILD